MCDECPICISSLFPKSSSILKLKRKVIVKRNERLPITQLKCGHMYHNSCIQKWFTNTKVESSHTCPMCRVPIRFKQYSKHILMNKLRHKNQNSIQPKPNDYTVYTFRFPVGDGPIDITQLESIDWESLDWDHVELTIRIV